MVLQNIKHWSTRLVERWNKYMATLKSKETISHFPFRCFFHVLTFITALQDFYLLNEEFIYFLIFAMESGNRAWNGNWNYLYIVWEKSIWVVGKFSVFYALVMFSDSVENIKLKFLALIESGLAKTANVQFSNRKFCWVHTTLWKDLFWDPTPLSWLQLTRKRIMNSKKA